MNSGKAHFLRGIIWSSGGSIVGLGVSTLTVLVGVRVLSKDQLGAYFLVSLIAQFGQIFGDFGLRNTIIRFLASAYGQERVSISQYLFTLRGIATLFVCSAIAVLTPLFLYLWPSNEFAKIVWYSVPLTAVLLEFQMGQAILTAYQMFGIMSIITASSEIIRMILSLSLLYFGFGSSALLLGLILSRIVALAYMWAIKPFPVRLRIRHPQRVHLLKFSGWLQVSSLMSFLNARMADTFITTYLGTALLAVYSTAMQMPSVIQNLFEAIRPVVLGYVSSLEKKTAVEHSVIAVRLIAGVVAIPVAMVIGISEPLIKLVFTTKYIDAVPVAQLLFAWCAFGVVNYYLALALIGLGRVKTVFLLTLPQGVIMLAGCVLLIPRYHAVGAASSLVVTSIIGNLLVAGAIVQGNRSAYARLCWAFFRSAIPVALLLMVELFIKPPTWIGITAAIMAIGSLYVSRAVTYKDLKILFASFFGGM